MAVKTLYWKDAVPTGATLHRSLQDGGAAPTTATTGTGWVAGTNVLGQSCIQNGGSEVIRTDGQWGATLQPNAAPSQTLGDCWRSELPYDGTFANANWTFAFGIRSVTAAYTGRLKLAVRVWRSSSPNGSNAVELTSGRVASAATSANLSTSADTTVSFTWSPGAELVVLGQYLFVNVGIEVTSAGGGTTQDVDFRVGSAYTIATSDFTPTPAGSSTAARMATIAAIPLFALGAALVSDSDFAVRAAARPFVNPSTITPDATRVRQTLADGSESSRALYDAALAVTRTPLFIARRELPPVLNVSVESRWQPATLQPIVGPPPPPVVNAPTHAPDLHARLALLADASRSSRAVLDAVASTDLRRGALFVARREIPPVLYLPADTTQRQPIGLQPVEQPAPFVAAPGAAPARLPWQPRDTTLGTSTTRFPALLPPGAVAPITAHRFPWLPADTSRATAKTLFSDAQLPVGDSTPVAAQNPNRTGADTTRSSPLTLLAAIALPPGKAADVGPQRPRWQPLDTSQRAYGTTYPAVAAVAPFVPAPHLPPLRRPWIGSETSSGTPKPAYSDAQLPVRNTLQTAPERLRATPTAASQAPSQGLLNALVLPPGAATPVTLLALRPLHADGSRSTPPQLLDVAPFVNPPQPLAEWLHWAWPAADTSQQAFPLRQPVPLPPGANVTASAPPTPELWMVRTLGTYASPVTITLVAVPVAVRHGDRGQSNRDHATTAVRTGLDTAERDPITPAARPKITPATKE